MHSTPEALLRRAAEGLVTDRAELTARIERGLAEVSAGQLLPHDQVMARARDRAQALVGQRGG